MTAAERGMKEVTQVLLDAGANPYIRDDENYNSLEKAQHSKLIGSTEKADIIRIIEDAIKKRRAT